MMYDLYNVATYMAGGIALLLLRERSIRITILRVQLEQQERATRKTSRRYAKLQTKYWALQEQPLTKSTEEPWTKDDKKRHRNMLANARAASRRRQEKAEEQTAKLLEKEEELNTKEANIPKTAHKRSKHGKETVERKKPTKRKKQAKEGV